MKAPLDIAVADCGMGNLHSVMKAMKKVAPQMTVELADSADKILRARRVVFPGDGAFAACMKELTRRRLADAIVRAAAEKPFLGICVGMQMLFEKSEEGPARGLGILRGSAIRLTPKPGVKIPHMGWNKMRHVGRHQCLDGIADGARFYFVHSYGVEAESSAVAGWSEHGGKFAAAVARGKLFAVQFHPEKSRDSGLRLLKNFVAQPLEN